MSNLKCDACDDLRDTAPEFVNEGVNDKICASLQNDTGLNPDRTTVHTDCEDLHTANDCLIGRLDREVITHDECDWKGFMRRLLPNLYEFLKAMICAMCGLWANVHAIWAKIEEILTEIADIKAQIARILNEISQIWTKLNSIDISDLINRITNIENKLNNIDINAIWAEITRIWNAINAIDLTSIMQTIQDIQSEITRIWSYINQIHIDLLDERVEDLCELVSQNIEGTRHIYGMNNGTAISGQTARSGGEIMQKNGVPLATPRSSVGDYDSLGVEYRKRTFKTCDGSSTKTYEWVIPRMLCWTLANNIEHGDVIWRVSKTKASEWGMTTGFLNWLRDYPQWWPGFGNSIGNVKECTLKLAVVGNYLELSMIGSTTNMQGAYIDAGPGSSKLFVS